MSFIPGYAGGGGDDGGGGQGISALTGGVGIAVSNSNDDYTISNTGVLSLTTPPGSGIIVGGTSNAPVLGNNGVLSITAGAGLSNTGTAQNPVLVATYTNNPIVQSVQTNQPSNPAFYAGTTPSPASLPILQNPITFSSCGINPANYNFIEVSCGFSVATIVKNTPALYTPPITFYAYDGVGSKPNTGDSKVVLSAVGNDPYYPVYARFTMSKALGHFSASSTSFQIYYDTGNPATNIPAGFNIYNSTTLNVAVRAYNF